MTSPLCEYNMRGKKEAERLLQSIAMSKISTVPNTNSDLPFFEYPKEYAVRDISHSYIHTLPLVFEQRSLSLVFVVFIVPC